MSTPETVCDTHGTLPSRDGECIACAERGRAMEIVLSHPLPHGRKNELLNALADRIRSDETLASSETKAKWRPVSEKPPCANQYIALIALPDCDEPRVAQRYYSMTGKWDSDYVTHWMPFPEAP